jgi:hypothetical protein
MSHLARPTLRLVIGPAVVAAFAGFELRHAGTFAAAAAGWCVFMISVVALAAWGRLQMERTRRRLQSLRSRRASKTR